MLPNPSPAETSSSRAAAVLSPAPEAVAAHRLPLVWLIIATIWTCIVSLISLAIAIFAWMLQ